MWDHSVVLWPVGWNCFPVCLRMSQYCSTICQKTVVWTHCDLEGGGSCKFSRHNLVSISWRERISFPVIHWAFLLISAAFWSCALLKLPCNSGDDMFDDVVTEGLKDSDRLSKDPSDCYAFLTIAVMCTDYVRSSVNWSQRNLKLLILSTASFKVREVCFLAFLPPLCRPAHQC